jgi:maltose O-acetyltransferase
MSFKYNLIFKISKYPQIICNDSIRVAQFLVLSGEGSIFLGKNVSLGMCNSPGHKRGEFYLEARGSEATITINDGVSINNNAVIIVDKSSITIGCNTLIGPNFTCFDSDFHSLNPNERLSSEYKCKDVIIGENVFIGVNVTILKGCVVGDNSVIGAGCILKGTIPRNSIVTVAGCDVTKLKVQGK